MNVLSKPKKVNKFSCWVLVIGIIECIFGRKHVMERSMCWIWQRRVYILVWIRSDGGGFTKNLLNKDASKEDRVCT